MNIPENFDRWMFDYKEGNLSGAEKEAFERFLIQNPKFEVEADAWNNSFIQNEEFVYPHADQLEKDNKVVGLYVWSAAAAIALLLIGTSVFLLNSSNTVEVNSVSATNEVTEGRLLHINELSTPALDQNRTKLIEELAELSASNPENVGLEMVDHMNQMGNNGQDGVQYQLAVNDVRDGRNISDDNYSNGHDSYSSSVTDGQIGDKSHPSITNPAQTKDALDQELAKYESEYKSKYLGNPVNTNLGFDVARKEHYDYGSFKNQTKRFFNKVKKSFDIPPSNLTNLGDPEILLPYTSTLGFNPAFAGGFNSARVELNYRNQWLGSEQNSQQLSVSFDKYIPQMRGGIGILIGAKDYQYGQYGDYNVSLMYSPKIKVGKNVIIEPAVKMTLGVLNADGNRLSPDAQLELDRGRVISTPAAQQMQGMQQLWYKDYGLGLMVNTDKFYIGGSVDNLNHHFENVYNEEGFATPTSSPIVINAIAGVDFDKKDMSGLSKPFSASPFVAYHQFGDRKELWGGVNFRYNWITLGGSIAHTKDFTASLGMKFEKFKMVYHYDHTMSALENKQIGSHNLSIRFIGGGKNKPRRITR